MRILVAGKSGQVAQALWEKSLSGDLTVIAVGRPELDICNALSLQNAMEKYNPDIVINAAAYTAVDKAQQESDMAFSVNREGPRLLAQNCNLRNIPLIHLSSDYVFDGTKPGAYCEKDCASPLGVYGLSKLEGERVVAENCARHLIFRTSWVYSPFGNNFVKTMLALAEDRDALSVVDDQYGCPTYALHIANTLLKICQSLNGKTHWGTYNLAGAGSTSWCGLAKEVFTNSRLQNGPFATVAGITTEQYPTSANRPKNSRLNCTKLLETFGIALPNWQTGTADCVSRLINTAHFSKRNIQKPYSQVASV